MTMMIVKCFTIFLCYLIVGQTALNSKTPVSTPTEAMQRVVELLDGAISGDRRCQSSNIVPPPQMISDQEVGAAPKIGDDICQQPRRGRSLSARVQAPRSLFDENDRDVIPLQRWTSSSDLDRNGPVREPLQELKGLLPISGASLIFQSHDTDRLAGQPVADAAVKEKSPLVRCNVHLSPPRERAPITPTRLVFFERKALEPPEVGVVSSELTVNSRGSTFEVSPYDEIAKKFFRRLEKYPQKTIVLEIGAGNGAPVSLKAVAKYGVKKIFVNDLCEEHLRRFQDIVPFECQADITLLPGSFPDGVGESLVQVCDVVYCARVMHFLPPALVKRFIHGIHNALKPGGQAFIQVDTLNMKGWEGFHEVYERLKADGEEFPGLVTNVYDYHPDLRGLIPGMLNFLGPIELMRLFREQGFEVEEAFSYDRPDYPLFMRGKHGEESAGIIVRKPVISRSSE